MRSILAILLFILPHGAFANTQVFDGITDDGVITDTEYQLPLADTLQHPVPPYYGLYTDVFSPLRVQVLRSDYINSNLVLNYGGYQYQVFFPNTIQYLFQQSYVAHGIFNATFYNQFGQHFYCRFPVDFTFQYTANGDFMESRITMPSAIHANQFGQCFQSPMLHQYFDLQKH